MELHSFVQAPSSSDRLRSHIGRLIELVGSQRFEPEMFKVVREVTGCEHLTAFAAGGTVPPRVLIASNAGPPVARTLARKYVASFWRLDPANCVDLSDGDVAGAALRICPSDIDDASYRYQCYTSVRLQDRFTVMQRRGRETFRINFYQAARGRRISNWAIDNVMKSADLLIALLAKHDVAASPASGRLGPELFQERLSLLEPTMPMRETQVCAAIMLGMTSEAIALSLGISLNTVLTYRKRAYARLGISSQNELVHLVLL
ncbi:MAG: helix-turn-helix transcriptional regulator [Hyphomicrobiales bacterium]